MDGEEGADLEGFGLEVLPKLKDEGAAGGSVVGAGVGDPIEVEHGREVEQVGVVSDEEESQVGGSAGGTRDGLAGDGLLERAADVVEGGWMPGRRR